MLEIKQTWSWDGSSGGLTPVNMDGCLESVLYVQCSTIASTASFQFQTAISSGGPWATEDSTSISATATLTSCDRLRVTGPYPYARFYAATKSTGTHTVVLMAVS
jgi:hypothetical protein